MSGFTFIHRRVLRHPVFRNEAEALAFVWLIMRAAWQPTKVRYKDRLISLQRGQVAVSQRDMARALDRDKAWVERLWKRLKDEAMVEAVPEAGREAGVSVLNICNYNDYQSFQNKSEAAGEAEARQARGTEQEIEGNKETKEKKDGGAGYAFEGKVIRLKSTDLERWRKTFHAIPDIVAELTSIDGWLFNTPTVDRKKWFHQVQGMLNKKHQAAMKPETKKDHRAYLNEPLQV